MCNNKGWRWNGSARILAQRLLQTWDKNLNKFTICIDKTLCDTDIRHNKNLHHHRFVITLNDPFTIVSPIASRTEEILLSRQHFSWNQIKKVKKMLFCCFHNETKKQKNNRIIIYLVGRLLHFVVPSSTISVFSLSAYLSRDPKIFAWTISLYPVVHFKWGRNYKAQSTNEQ